MIRICLVVCLSSLLIDRCTVAHADASKPNVLMIAIDDLRPELACYGADHIVSPNIDRLASEGVRFNRAYCQVAVCGASRGSLLSGCRPETTTIWDYKTPLRSVMPNVLTLPGHFKAAGYRTATLGKIYHARNDDSESFNVDIASIAPPRRGQGNSYVRAYPQYDGGKATGKSKKPKVGPSHENGGNVADNAYVDGHNAERAVEMLHHFAEQPQPFFFAVGFIKPHLPFNAPARYWDLYDRDTIEIPSREPMKNSPSWAASGWGELKNYPDIDRKMDPLDDETTRTLIHGYYAATSYADAQVGKLINALEETGLDKNTIVVLWGDHGWYVGDFGDWCKHTNYEIATRVPLIVRLPRKSEPGDQTPGDAAIDAGVTDGLVEVARSSDALVELVDIYPTLCDLTGTEIPKHVHGHSFAPLMSAPDQPWKSAAFSQYVRYAPKPEAKIRSKNGRKPGPRRVAQLGTSIRTDRYRYTRWADQKGGDFTTEELVDFQTDPGATINVAADPQYAEVLPKLRALASQSAIGTAPKATAPQTPAP